VDLAGSGVVHLLGGTCGLVGTIILGPRKGRFEESDDISSSDQSDFKPHNVGLFAIGVLILWFGWYGFNTGSIF